MGLRCAAQIIESVLQGEEIELVDPEFVNAIIDHVADACIEKYFTRDGFGDENRTISKHLMPELLSFKHRLSNDQIPFEELKQVALYKGRINTQQLKLFAALKDHSLMYDAEKFINNLQGGSTPDLDPLEF